MSNEHNNLINEDFWGLNSTFPTRYFMLLIAVLSQVATVAITWQLWQVRSAPAHLPVIDLPQIPFGILMLLSTLCILVAPRKGLIAHCFVIVIASLFDQFRLQPQFLAIIVLMWAAVSDLGLRVCRWFLATLWLWAGIHKLLSAQWFSFAAHWILGALTNNDATTESYFWHFAMAVAVGEIAVGLMGVFATRTAAFFCVVMHLSIFFMLVIIDWNFSVLPWNLGTAIVGTWVMWSCQKPVAALDAPTTTVSSFNKAIEYLIAVILFVAPAGFYWGLIDHGYASVLYSDGIPRGFITKQNHLEYIRGWDPVHVPFPSERRTFLKYFEQVAKDGDKLHIFDPREALADQFFVFRQGQAVEINQNEFFSSIDNELAGIGYSDRYALFWLSRWGKISFKYYLGKESKLKFDSIPFGYTASPENYSPKMLELLLRLPNLEQLQLANCPVSDSDLQIIGKMRRLDYLGLSNTAVTDSGLTNLKSLSRLKEIEIEDTQISIGGLRKLQQQLQSH